MKTYCLLFVLILVFLFAFTSTSYAKVWINEFSSNGSEDWIELYNDAPEPFNLETLNIRDNTVSNTLPLSGEIAGNEYAVFEWGSKLNNGGDTIKLVSANDENTVIDQIVYGSSGDIGIPASGQSAGRQTNGGSTLVLFGNPSKDATNADSQLAPTATSIPQKTPTPVKEPTPTRTPTPKKTPTPIKSPTTKASAESDDDEGTTTATTKSLQTTSAKLPKISGVPTSILGIASKAATPKPKAKISGKLEENVMVKSAVAPPYLIMASGTVFCAACGILVFLKKRKKNQES